MAALFLFTTQSGPKAPRTKQDLCYILRLNNKNSWEKGFSKTTYKQSQTNDRNRQIQSNYEG